MPQTEAQINAKKRWVEKNKDLYNAKQRELALKYYYTHKDEILEKKKQYYLDKKAKIKQSEETIIKENI